MHLKNIWVLPSRADLLTERRQCIEEGKDISAFDQEFKALDVDGVDSDPELIARAGRLFDELQRLPVRDDFEFSEPSGLRQIQSSRPPQPKLPDPPNGRDTLLDKAHGAWTARCCGCLLGKTVEGRRRGQIRSYLEHQGRWPLSDYFSNQADASVRSECRMPPADAPMYAENITHMCEDDDTNYTVAGLAMVSDKATELTPLDVAEFWLRNLPFYHVCTAERVAYRNLVNMLPVPDNEGNWEGEFCSATYRNPYREWIGAQIRGDFFGYVLPGRCEQAAELAWRDAAISHVKNGIYGEMWASATIAAAWCTDSPAEAIRAGLTQVPQHCRLRRDIEQVFAWREGGMDYAQAVDAIHQQWDETDKHHWCHTNSNAQIVTLSLLWGERELERTICLAVMPGFDTDCNAATAGSILGVILGRKAMPAKWTDPIGDTLVTGVHGYHEVKLTDLAEHTVELMPDMGR
ncbi:MAG: ADP-ribosylglycohydrolase family protein [Phycisphaerae bacterium]